MPKIAIAQIKVVGDVDKNLSRILAFIEKASARNADIVCFPETCLNTYRKIIPVKSHIKQIQTKCRKLSIYCIFGSYLKEKNKIYNIIFLINRKGKIQYKYYKVHLWKNEAKFTTAGKANKVIKTDFGEIGIVNCWDYAFPEYIKKLAKNGAKIIFCPAYLVGYKIEKEVLRRLPLVRAFENMSYFILVDAFTKETLSESFICHPLKFLSKIERREGIILANLNFKEIDSLRKYFGLP